MELERILRRWLLVQAISMMFLFSNTWIMLELLGVPLALLLALLTGAMTFVPYMGPIIAIIPILIVSFMDRPILALYAGLLYLVIQNIEENIMMPLLCQKTIHLPAVLTIVGQLVFGGVFGTLGFMLATPLMAVGLVLVQKIYVKRFLGDPMGKNMKDLVKIK
jgi:predicted PurR-regulated permease PerM